MQLFNFITEFPDREITEDDTYEMLDLVHETMAGNNFYHLIHTTDFQLSKTDNNKVSIVVGVLKQ